MRLEPVYLLAPKPKPPSVPTRRAFLIAGSTFVAGLGLGGACGYAAGTSRGVPKPVDPFAEEMKPTGDSDLDELRRLAVKAPIAELMENSVLFLELLGTTYSKDKTLWFGATRIGTELIQNDQVTDRRKKARWLAQVITNGAPQLSAQARKQLPYLLLIR